jgi:FkbM family methyltransferase
MPSVLHRLSRAVMHCYPFANGQGRIIDRSFLGRLRFSEETLEVKCPGGYTMEVMPNDHIGRHLYLTGQFDPCIVRVLKGFCRQGDERILDIGANVGSVSCALLHAMPHCRVVAIEPQPAIHSLLLRNLARVGNGEARTLNVAVSDRDGEGVMSRVDGNSGCCRIVDRGGDADSTTIPVKMLNGERLMEASGLDRIDLIKIDVEGLEETILRSMKGTIMNQKPRAIVFEHRGDLRRRDSGIREVLEGCGYTLSGIQKSITTHALIPIERLSVNGIWPNDFVAVRR